MEKGSAQRFSCFAKLKVKSSEIRLISGKNLSKGVPQSIGSQYECNDDEEEYEEQEDIGM